MFHFQDCVRAPGRPFFLFTGNLRVAKYLSLRVWVSVKKSDLGLTLSLNMKVWTNEHIFNHSWEKLAQNQWRKYPNPHNQAVLGTDVFERHVSADGKLHSHRLITSDWGLAPWVQTLIGANRYYIIVGCLKLKIRFILVLWPFHT